MAQYATLFSDEVEENPVAQDDGYTSIFADEAKEIAPVSQDAAQGASRPYAADGYDSLFSDEVNLTGGGGNSTAQRQPVYDGRNVGNAGAPMRPEDFANEPAMGGVELQRLRDQAAGAPVADPSDGSFTGWLKNLGHVVAHNSSGRAMEKYIEMNLQDILRGTVRKDGKDVPLTELPDSELDYLVDAAGWNGAGAWFKRFLGPWARSDSGMMQDWDRTEGAKIADPSARKAARVRYAQEMARNITLQNERDKQAAQAEIEERESQVQSGHTAGLAQTGSYMLPYLAPRIGSFLAGVIGGFERGFEMASDRYEMDENGNVRVAAERDSTGTAIAKGVMRGIMEPVVEMVGGKLATKALGGLAGATLGRIPLVKSVGGKIAATGAGKALAKYGKTMDRLGKMIGLQGAPEEVIEEFEDSVFDAALGIDRRESEKQGGALQRAGEAAKDFFKPESLKNLAESMLLVQILGGGIAHVNDRYRSKPIDNILAESAGIDKGVLKDYTADEKWAAYEAYVNGLTEEQVRTKLGKGADAVNELADVIAKGTAKVDDFRDAAYAMMDADRAAPENAAADAQMRQANANRAGDFASAKEAESQQRALNDAAERGRAEERSQEEMGARIERQGEAMRRNAATAQERSDYDRMMEEREETRAQNRAGAAVDGAGARGAERMGEETGAAADASEGAEAALEGAQTEPPPPEVVDRPNRLRRQQPNNFRHPGDNRLRPAVPDIDQQPIRETNDETGNGADEAPAQPEQGAERPGTVEAPRPEAGAAPGAQAPDAGVVGTPAPEAEAEPTVDSPAFKRWLATKKGKVASAAMLRQFKHLRSQGKLDADGNLVLTDEQRAARERRVAKLREINARRRGEKVAKNRERSALHDKFINGEQMDPTSLFAFREDVGRLLSMPPRKRTFDRKAGKFRFRFVGDDPAVGALNNFFDGLKGDEYQLWMDRIFGKKAQRRPVNAQGNDSVLEEVMNYGRSIRDDGMTPDEQMADRRFNDFDGLLFDFAKEWGDYERWKSEGALTREERSLADREAEEERLARERQDEDEAEIYDFGELMAERDAMDEDFANALGVVEGADEADYAALSPSSLRLAEFGDTIRFDHDEKAFNFGSFDAGRGILTVYDEEASGRPGEKFRRVYRVTENRIEEIDDGQGNESGPDADRAGDEKGAASGRGQVEGQDGRGFALESATAKELAAEKARREQREEIRRRQEASLKGGGVEAGQSLLDLGGAEDEDLFNRTQRVETNRLRNAAGEDPLAAKGQKAAPDVAELTRRAQALAKEYADLSDREKVSVRGRDLEKRIAEAWDAVDAAERAENAPVAAPKKTGATTPTKAAKSAEGGKSASGATPAAPTPEMRRKATAAMRILGADAGKDAAALEAELRQMEERGQAASGPGRRKAEALRDLAAYKRAVGTKEVLAEEIAEGRQRDAEQRIIEGNGERLPSEDFYGRRQSRGKGDMPAKWTDVAKRPLERVAHTLRNVVTIGGKKLKVSFAERPADVDGQTRKSIGGVFTGTAADYANRSRQGGVDDGPSVKHIGTGEGSQVYGWGLYGSNVRGVAEGYATPNHLTAEGLAASALWQFEGKRNEAIKRLQGYIDKGGLSHRDFTPEEKERTQKAIQILKDHKEPNRNLYEQTFFTDRAPGDESHLLKWYEPVSEEQLGWIDDTWRKENPKVTSDEAREKLFARLLDGADGQHVYGWLSETLGSPQAASEFLARAGIDGVKYPVDSYGGKGVKDGDKAGWNYVSFRDDNIRVDHKWTDGKLRYMRNGDGEVVGEYDAEKGEIRLYPGATVADVVHEFTHPLVDFARAEAKAGRGEFLNKIKGIIDTERATWEKPVRDAYADKGEGEILEEIFTHAMGEKGATLFGKSTTTLEGRRWYNRLWDAIKGVWQDFATKMGWNKADLRGLDEMSPENAAQKILSEMAKGRSFGDAMTGGEGTRNAVRNGVSAEEGYNPRSNVPNVRGGWTEQKILRYLKANPSRSGVKAASRLIAEFASPEELKEHMFYHGTRNGVSQLLPSITKSDAWAERNGGGGYGQRYWGISVSKSKRVASNFGNQSPGVSIYPIVLAKNAKVIDRADLVDAADVADHIVELWNDGVDAVRLGDWKSDYSEQELFVLNPRAICNIGTPDYYRYFRLGSPENPLNIKNDAQIDELYEAAKEYAGYSPVVKFGKPTPPSMFADGSVGGLKPKDVRDAERAQYEKELAAWRDSEQGHAAEDYERNARDVIRYSRRVTPPGVPPVPTNQDIQDYLGGEDGFMRRLRRMFQDKNIVIRDVEERLGVTDKDASVYYAKDRAFGKNEHELTVLQKREVEPIVEKIHKSGGSLELFSAYLYARHSGERNAALKASKGVENGSGMTKEQADTIFKAVDRLGLRAAFEDAAKDVWAMNRKYLQRRVDSGRMTQADYDFYTQKYKHYVPLRTDMTDEELDIFNSTTGGWKRNELMAAQGRKSAADDPLAFSIVQNEQAIRASNANEVRRRFAGLVRRSKGALGEVVDGVSKGGAKWSFTFGDGETVETGSPMRLASERDDIVLFKENGRLKAVKVNPGEHGRGLDLARAVTDKDVAQFNRHLEWIPRATRWMSAMRTQYVPTFIVRNMKADNLEVMLNALSERGVKDGAKFFGKFLKNEVSVAKGVKEYFKTGKSSDRFVQEAVENGLLTGGGMSAEGFTETAERLSDTLQALRERPNVLGGSLKAAKDTISLLNACAEYNTRMGVYKTLREEGMSVADAVSYARDVTVNFNRKGYLTPYTNAAFMFSNAAVQGMGRAFKSMNSEHGKEVLVGLFLVGVAQALLDDWLGHDDESEKSGGADSRNLTEYDKSHSLGVALPTGHRVKTGIRNPWALPMYAGRKAVELLKGITSGEQAMKDLASEVGQFVTEPVGGNGFDSTSEFLQTLAPTIIDPFVQWGTGKDYRGQDRLKKSFDKYAPDSWNGKDSTPEAYKAVAKALNFISGGNEHRKGAFDVAPENVRLLTETVFGGVLTDLNNLIKGGEHAVDAVRGKPAAQIARDIPFLRDTFTNMPDNTSRFYAALDAYNADKAEFKKTTELGRRRDMKREKPYLMQGKGRVDKLIERVKELRHLERGEVKTGQKWVERKTPLPEERKRRFREQRLEAQARILKILGG